MKTQELMNFIEKLRIKRKINQEDFLDGEISTRQYNRYRLGESEPSFTTLVLLVEKLGFSMETIFSYYDVERRKETKIILEYYNAISNHDFLRAEELNKEIELEAIFIIQNRKIYEISLTLLEFCRQRINSKTFVNRLKNIINYNEIKNLETFSDVETMAIGHIVDSSLEVEEEIRILEKIVVHKDNFSGNMLFSKLQTLFFMIKYYGSHKEFKKALYYSDLGIEICQKYRVIYELDYFYYFKGAAHYHLTENENIDICFAKCLVSARIISKERYLAHKNILVKKFNIDMQKLIEAIDI